MKPLGKAVHFAVLALVAGACQDPAPNIWERSMPAPPSTARSESAPPPVTAKADVGAEDAP
jgi:hypothetical protein